jgi:hypothetical protein
MTMGDVHVIPNVGTMLMDSSNGDGPVRASSVRRVLGTLIIDAETAILHCDDGPAVVLADNPRSLAFIKAQAGHAPEGTS